ncbi:MAG: permease [Ardenticatenales bacterium]|nr:permease [Ardenticatenales bacterium]
MDTSEPYNHATPQAKPPREIPTSRRPLVFAIGILLLILATYALTNWTPPAISSRFRTFVTIFLGILVEALPFLLAGSIVSGLIEVYVDRGAFDRFLPRRPIPAAFVGALLGFAFPVCECGVVPVTRRLYQKGMPLSVGIAFLLAAPVVNPVVLISTYAAFGWGPVFFGRVGFSILIAFAIGLLFTFAKPDEILRPDEARLCAPDHEHDHDHDHGHGHARRSIWQALSVGGDDFLDMARYLIMGSALAAAMQTLVPQATLLALGRGPVISVVTLMLLAFVLSVCSTVDAFLALSFVSTFTTGSILSFLVFGPMVDIKSSLMFLGVFRRRTVLYLILLPLCFALVLGIFVNLNLGW